MEEQQEWIQLMLDYLESITPPDSLIEGLTVLEQLFQNIIKNPLDKKYRTINSSNDIIKKKIFTIKQIEKLLILLGYRLREQSYVLDNDHLNQFLNNSEFVAWRTRLLVARYSSMGQYEEAKKLVAQLRNNRVYRMKLIKQQSRLRKLTQSDKQQRKYFKKYDQTKSRPQYGNGAGTKGFGEVKGCKKPQGSSGG